MEDLESQQVVTIPSSHEKRCAVIFLHVSPNFWVLRIDHDLRCRVWVSRILLGASWLLKHWHQCYPMLNGSFPKRMSINGDLGTNALTTPLSPARPVTMNQGQLRPSWFDLSRMPPPDHEYDEVGIAESTAAIENLVLTQVHSGVDPSQIVLVGFSQGAALGMLVSLTTLYELGGVASLSGWIPRQVRSVS